MSYANTPRSPAGIAVTIAVHAGLIAVALAGVRIAVPPAPPPPIAIVNHDAPKPPPARRIEPVTHQQRIDPLIIAPVIDIAEPPKADTSLTATTRDAGPGPGPVDTVTDFRIEPQPPAGATRSASIDARYRSQFQPIYPSASQRLGEEGTVLVRVVVGVDGRVVRATVVKSSGFARLDAAAIERALTKWRFVPALNDGVAVEAERELPVTFRLRQG